MTTPIEPTAVLSTWPATVAPPLDPYLRGLAEAQASQPPIEGQPLDEVRQARARAAAAMPALAEPVGSVQTLTVAGPGGALPLRLYRPTGTGPWPVVVYYHGGGWVLGDLESHDDYCRSLCLRTPALVVSVDYRLSPEVRFPAGLDDCLAATRWAAETAGRYGGDGERLLVAGDSAGGNLAAAVALRARDEGGPPLAGQLLIYPITNAQLETASYHHYSEGYGLTRRAMGYFWECYLTRPADGDHPYASPLRAPSLAGLPPTLIQTAQYDPLCDEGEAYAARLAREGVAVRAVRYLGMNHGFARHGASVAAARQALAEAADFLGQCRRPTEADGG